MAKLSQALDKRLRLGYGLGESPASRGLEDGLYHVSWTRQVSSLPLYDQSD